jgi:hypothetical protein
MSPAQALDCASNRSEGEVSREESDKTHLHPPPIRSLVEAEIAL